MHTNVKRNDLVFFCNYVKTWRTEGILHLFCSVSLLDRVFWSSLTVKSLRNGRQLSLARVWLALTEKDSPRRACTLKSSTGNFLKSKYKPMGFRWRSFGTNWKQTERPRKKLSPPVAGEKEEFDHKTAWQTLAWQRVWNPPLWFWLISATRVSFSARWGVSHTLPRYDAKSFLVSWLIQWECCVLLGFEDYFWVVYMDY